MPGAFPPYPRRRIPGHQQACSTRWLQLLAGGRTNAIFAVGDDDQSDLRLARRRGRQHARFRARIRMARTSSSLEQNYRSHGNILAAANALIKNNRERLGKNLWTEAGEGEPIRCFEGYSDLDEARLRRRGNPRTGARRHFADPDRAALPLQRPVARARKRVVHEECAVQGLWRPALLRAPGNQARAGLPAPARQPGPTTPPSCASSISRRAASAPVRWKTCRPRRTR